MWNSHRNICHYLVTVILIWCNYLESFFTFTINSLELSAAIIISVVVVGGKIVVIVEFPLVISKVDSATSCVLKVEICKTELFLIVYSSPEPTTPLIYSGQNLSLFVAVVVPCRRKNSYFFSRTHKAILFKHGTKHPWWRTFIFDQLKGKFFFKVGINMK